MKATGDALTKAGRWLAVLALPWALGVIFASDALLAGLGFPTGSQSPVLLRLVIVAVALAPAVVWMLHPRLGRLPGFRWLLESTQPSASVDREGIELALPKHGVRRFDWDTVASLVPRQDWRHPARLVGTDGTTLAVLPDSLIYPRAGPTSKQTLAQIVVDTRPDRYALSGANWAGLPDACAMTETIDKQFDIADARRRRSIVVGGLFAILLAGAIAAGIAWIVLRA